MKEPEKGPLKRSPLTPKQREIRDGDFLVRRAAVGKACNEVREAVSHTVGAQKRLTEVSKDIEVARDKASKAQDLFDRARVAQAQHFYMTQEAERLFGDAAGSSEGVAATVESLIDTLRKAADTLSGALDPLQALARAPENMHAAERARTLLKQIDQSVQRSVAALAPARRRLTAARDARDAKGLAAACQQVKTVVFQVTLSAGSLLQAASQAQESSPAAGPAPAAPKDRAQELSNMSGPARTPLPIDEHRDGIVAAVKTKAVVCIQGQTGCGKSSRVPQYIYNYCRGAAQYLRGGDGERTILCIQPRQIAAVGLARHVAKEMGEAKVGGLVGYRTLGDSCSDPKKTKILYMSMDLFLSELYTHPARIRGYSHIVWDEVHERSVDADLVSLILKLHLQHRIADFKLIVMSATFEDGIFANYFQDDNEVIAPPPALPAGGSCYDVETLYLEDLLPFGTALGATDGAANLADELRQRSGKALRGPSVTALKDGLEHFRKLEQQLKQLEKSKTPTTVGQLADFGLLGGDAESEFWRANPELVPSLGTCPAPLVFMRPQMQRGMEQMTVDLVKLLGCPGGSILVVLPGAPDVAELFDALVASGAQAGGTKLEVVVLQPGECAPEHADECYALKDGFCKVFLASAAAESSLTLPKVKVVIDFCLRQTLVHDHTRRGMHFALTHWTSRATSTQRAGRCGRTCAGVTIRMVPRTFYEAVMPAYDTPEIEQAPLEHLFLKLKDYSEKLFKNTPRLGLQHPRRLAQLAVQPASPERLEETARSLLEAGALTHRLDEQAALTVLGRLALALPLELRLCRLVLFGVLFGCPADAVVMAAALGSQDPFTLPSIDLADHAAYSKAAVKSYQSRQFFDDGALSEPVMLRNLFMTWLRGLKLTAGRGAAEQPPRGDFAKRSAELAKSHAVSAERLTEFALVVAETARKVLPFLPPEPTKAAGGDAPAKAGSPARAALVKLLADLGLQVAEGQRPAVDPIGDRVQGDGLFSQDLLLVKSTLTASFAPMLANGVVRCADWKPGVPGPRAGEGGILAADPDIAALHQLLLKDQERIGASSRHCFTVPQVPERLRQNSNTWVESLKDILGAGKRRFKKMQLMDQDAFFLFEEGDSEQDSDSDMGQEAVSDDDVRLPEMLEQETLPEAPEEKPEAPAAKAAEPEPAAAREHESSSDSESGSSESDAKAKSPERADAAAEPAKAGEPGRGDELAVREGGGSDEELERIEREMEQEERKNRGDGKQLKLKDARKSKKAKDKKRGRSKEKKKSSGGKDKKKKRSKSAGKKRSRSRSRRRRGGSSSGRSGSAARRPRLTLSSAELARAAAAAAAAFSEGALAEEKPAVDAAPVTGAAPAPDKHTPFLSMLRGGNTGRTVQTAFSGLTDEQKEKHQRRLERLKAIQVAAEERQRTELEIKAKADKESVLAKLKAREEKKKKKAELRALIEKAAAEAPDAGKDFQEIIDLASDDEKEDVMVLDDSGDEAAKGDASKVRFAVGDKVEAFGLSSETGASLNGQFGIVLQVLEESDRYEIEFPNERIVSLRTGNVRAPKADGDEGSKDAKGEEGDKDTKGAEGGEAAEAPAKASKPGGADEDKGESEDDKDEKQDKAADADAGADAGGEGAAAEGAEAEGAAAEAKKAPEEDPEFMEFLNDIQVMEAEAEAAEKSEAAAADEAKQAEAAAESPKAEPPAAASPTEEAAETKAPEAAEGAAGAAEAAAQEDSAEDFLSKLAESFGGPEAAAAPKEEPEDDEEEEEDDGLSSLPVVELRRRARAKGLTIPTGMNDKEELVALIREADKKQEEPPADPEASFADFLNEISEEKKEVGQEKGAPDVDMEAFLQEVASAGAASPPAGEGAAEPEAAAGGDGKAKVGGMDDAFAAFMSELGEAPAGEGPAEGQAAAEEPEEPEEEEKDEVVPEPTEQNPVVLRFAARQRAWVVRSLGAANRLFGLAEEGPIEARQRALRYCKARQQELQDREGGNQAATSSTAQPAGAAKDAKASKEPPAEAKDGEAVLAGGEVLCRGLGTPALNLLRQLCGLAGGGKWPWPMGSGAGRPPEVLPPRHPFQLQWCVPTAPGSRAHRGQKRPAAFGAANFRNPVGAVLSCPSKGALAQLRVQRQMRMQEQAAMEKKIQEEHQARIAVAVASATNPVEATMAVQLSAMQVAERLASAQAASARGSAGSEAWARCLSRLAVFAGPGRGRSSCGTSAMPLNGLTVLPTDRASSNALPILLLLAFLRPASCGGAFKGGCAALCDLDTKRLRAISLHGHREDSRWILPILGKRRLTVADLQRVNALRHAVSAAVGLVEAQPAAAPAKRKAAGEGQTYIREDPQIGRALGSLFADLGLADVSSFEQDAVEGSGSASGTAGAGTPEMKAAAGAAAETAEAAEPAAKRQRTYGDVWIDLRELGAPPPREPEPAAEPQAAKAKAAKEGEAEGESGPFFSFEASVEEITKKKDGEEGEAAAEGAAGEAAKTPSAAAAAPAAPEEDSKSFALLPTLTLPDAITERIEAYDVFRDESKAVAMASRAEVKEVEKRVRSLRAKILEVDEGAQAAKDAWDLAWAVEDGDKETVQKALEIATSTLQAVTRTATEMADIAQAVEDATNKGREREKQASDGLEVAPQFWKAVVKVLEATQERLKLHDQVMRAALKRSDEPRALALYQADLTIQLVNEKLRRWADEEKILKEEADKSAAKQERLAAAQQSAELEKRKQELEMQRQQLELAKQREASIQWGREQVQPVSLIFTSGQPPEKRPRGPAPGPPSTPVPPGAVQPPPPPGSRKAAAAGASAASAASAAAPPPPEHKPPPLPPNAGPRGTAGGLLLPSVSGRKK